MAFPAIRIMLWANGDIGDPFSGYGSPTNPHKEGNDMENPRDDMIIEDLVPGDDESGFDKWLRFLERPYTCEELANGFSFFPYSCW